MTVHNMVLTVHPQLINLLDEFRKEDDESDAYINFLSIVSLNSVFYLHICAYTFVYALNIQMTKAMNAARASDTNLFKYLIFTFLPPNVHTPINTVKAKDIRGWHHKWTARALCPIKRVEEFDNNPM